MPANDRFDDPDLVNGLRPGQAAPPFLRAKWENQKAFFFFLACAVGFAARGSSGQ
jgi:hypothetical protein